jgi:hypothetical protein
MDFKFEVVTYDAMLTMAVAHAGDHVRGIAAAAYAGELHVGNRSIEIWGYGGAKNVETLYAHGICHAIEEILLDREDDDFRFHVWVAAIGFAIYIRKYMPIWDANGGKNSSGRVPDAYDEWRRLWIMSNLGKLSIDKITPSKLGLGRIEEEVSRIAEIAHQRAAYRQVGIAKSGCDFKSAS